MQVYLLVALVKSVSSGANTPALQTEIIFSIIIFRTVFVLVF